MLEINKIHQGDCLKIMPEIEDKSIDMILCDLPYGTVHCNWDTIIPFEPLWAQYKRIIKDDGAVVLTSVQPFTTQLINSNPDMFKYCMVWDKVNASNFVQAKKSPLKTHEDICIFSFGTDGSRSKNPMKYNPQGLIKINKTLNNGLSAGGESFNKKNKEKSMFINESYIQEYTGYPKTILTFKPDNKKLHPTQKPVKLFEYLIKTYTNKNDIVLDNCAGSGTTGEACILTDRNYILIEMEYKYCNIIANRLKNIKPEKGFSDW